MSQSAVGVCEGRSTLQHIRAMRVLVVTGHAVMLQTETTARCACGWSSRPRHSAVERPGREWMQGQDPRALHAVLRQVFGRQSLGKTPFVADVMTLRLLNVLQCMLACMECGVAHAGIRVAVLRVDCVG